MRECQLVGPLKKPAWDTWLEKADQIHHAAECLSLKFIDMVSNEDGGPELSTVSTLSRHMAGTIPAGRSQSCSCRSTSYRNRIPAPNWTPSHILKREREVKLSGVSTGMSEALLGSPTFLLHPCQPVASSWVG